MNTLSYLTKPNIQTPDIEYVDYKDIREIIDALCQASTIPHEKYDSVKLYGDSLFILSALYCIMSDDKYSDITVASIEITSSIIDPACRDDYVLSLYDNELYIQSSWNDDYNCIYENEAKFTICQYGIPGYILSNAIKSETPIRICKSIIR